MQHQNKKEETINSQSWVGNYITKGYLSREKGYDWSVLSIEYLTDSTTWVMVRSRSDRKKPTCSFEAEAALIGVDSLSTFHENKQILFIKKEDYITIKMPKEEERNILYYFCSGGGSLANEYIHLKEVLDLSQLIPEK